MSKWDKDYLDLCKRILSEGVRVENRTGIDTIKVPSHHFHFDLSEEFPVLTTKQLFIRQAVLELLWFYQAQSNDVRWLQERNVHIWDEWEIDGDGFWTATQMVPDENGNFVPRDVVSIGVTLDERIADGFYFANSIKILRKFFENPELIDEPINKPLD